MLLGSKVHTAQFENAANFSTSINRWLTALSSEKHLWPHLSYVSQCIPAYPILHKTDAVLHCTPFFSHKIQSILEPRGFQAALNGENYAQPPTTWRCAGAARHSWTNFVSDVILTA